MTENKEIEFLLKNIQKGLSKYSVSELNQALVEFISRKGERKEEIDFVKNSVADYYKIPVKTLMKAQIRGVQQDAKQVCYCLLHFDLGLNIRYIAKNVFFNWPNSVNTGIRRFNFLSPNIKKDKEFLSAYRNVQQKLAQFVIEKNNI